MIKNNYIITIKIIMVIMAETMGVTNNFFDLNIIMIVTIHKRVSST